ncbi:hypothetical protein MXMO3_01686 [Maritalea myrionectae]|uniref:DUF1376 domain-containing protein n=1 Tax=Maritalea myrionectae TaxID=454601 RepID=A0A2R4MDX2_9HYPH|nr:YdaU family protein [Maritalea myrionectae]AVX04212.1 hypothetical protein MXMO3_01686 [Maritalea myrionectae]
MSLPYFPMYPSDFEAKTSHLTLAEDGAYNRLLRICWMTPGCTIPDDEAWIMRRVRALTDEDKEAVRTILAEFFTVENGRYSNAKLMQIWRESNKAHEKRKNAGAKGGKAKSLKNNNTAHSNAVAKPKQPEPEPNKEKELSKDSPKKGSRGSCLPDDWQPSNEFIDWPVQNLNWTINRSQAEAAKFKDYWIAKTGAGATKKDWLATWRNWCRNARPPGPDQIQRQETATQKLKREAQERWNLSTEGKHHDQSPRNTSGPLRLVASSTE